MHRHRHTCGKPISILVIGAALLGWMTHAPAADAQTPPASSRELFEWLKTESYKSWPQESEPHPSAGSHPGAVRTFLSPALAASLKAGTAKHPAGSAAVLELYGKRGTLHGWAVSIKTQGDSADGKGWYWYEVFSATDSKRTMAAEQGVAACFECHAKGRDFVMSPVPMR